MNAWPRDALVLGTTAFTNGLIGSSGRAGQKRTLLELLDRLAPSYGDDWWFTAHHGMALSENGQRDAARPKIDRSLAQNPSNPWAAHARAHLCYEEGDANAARAFLASWLTTYPRDGLLYSHLSWHLALGDLEAGDAAAALRLFREAFSPDVHSGPPRGKLNDAVSFLWRWELAGHPRDAEAWRVMHDFANGAFPRAGAAFSDMHIALAQAVAGDDAALEARARQIDELAREGRYPSGPFVPAVSRAFAAFERRDFSAAIDALEPIAGELERIGGSRAQLDLVRVHAVEGLSRRGPPGRCAPDAERAAYRRLGHSRCRVGGRALINETTATVIDLAQLFVRRRLRQPHNDRLIAECADEPQQIGRAQRGRSGIVQRVEIHPLALEHLLVKDHGDAALRVVDQSERCHRPGRQRQHVLQHVGPGEREARRAQRPSQAAPDQRACRPA